MHLPLYYLTTCSFLIIAKVLETILGSCVLGACDSGSVCAKLLGISQAVGFGFDRLAHSRLEGGGRLTVSRESVGRVGK